MVQLKTNKRYAETIKQYPLLAGKTFFSASCYGEKHTNCPDLNNNAYQNCDCICHDGGVI